MNRLSLMFALLVFAPWASGADEIEMGVFDMKIMTDGELTASPTVAVYLNKPDVPKPGTASITAGTEEGHYLQVILDIESTDENGAQVRVKYGYGSGPGDISQIEELVAMPWREETRLVYQRDSRSPLFEFFITLGREQENAFKERMKAAMEKSSG